MNDKHVNLIADSIVYAVQNQRPSISTILLKNGVIVPSGTSDAKLILLVSDVFKKSKPFQKDFASLMANSEYVSSSNFDGYSNYFGDYSVDNIDFSLPKSSSTLTSSSVLTKDSVLKSTPAVNSTNSGTPSTSFWTTSNIMGLFNKAADTYVSTSTDKANIALANAAQARANAGIVDDTSGTLQPPPKSNTALYVTLSIVAIAAIGGFIWYKNKSKK
jgi:hypothetical protein